MPRFREDGKSSGVRRRKFSGFAAEERKRGKFCHFSGMRQRIRVEKRGGKPAKSGSSVLRHPETPGGTRETPEGGHRWPFPAPNPL